MNSVDTAMQLDVPDWLNEAFIQVALQRGGESNLKVKEITIEAATAPGENFASTMFRVKVTPEHGENRTVIVKTLPTGHMAQLAEETGLFRNERIMFERNVFKMEDLLNAAAPNRSPPLAARCLHMGTTPVDFLVLEDLKPLGFKTADKQKGLGLRHCLLALRALGRFHAASAALLQQDPNAGDGLRNPFRLGTPTMESIVGSGISAAASACLSWPGFEEYGRILNEHKPFLMQKFGEQNGPKPGVLNVIRHGDFWCNNMMFRYEDGIPQEVRLVDLQMSDVAPPVVDLLYFLSSSLSEDVTIHHRDLLIREYHKALSEAMDLLALEPPSLEEILAEIDAHGTFMLVAGVCIFPIVKALNAKDLGSRASGEDGGQSSHYEIPVIKRWFQRILPEYKRRGWFPNGI